MGETCKVFADCSCDEEGSCTCGDTCGCGEVKWADVNKAKETTCPFKSCKCGNSCSCGASCTCGADGEKKDTKDWVEFVKSQKV